MKYCTHLFSVIMLFSLLSCSNKNNPFEYTLIAIPFEDNDNDSYGILDSKSNVIASGFEDTVTHVLNKYFVKKSEDVSHVLCKLDGDASYSVLYQTLGYDSFGVMYNWTTNYYHFKL